MLTSSGLSCDKSPSFLAHETPGGYLQLSCLWRVCLEADRGVRRQPLPVFASSSSCPVPTGSEWQVLSSWGPLLGWRILLLFRIAAVWYSGIAFLLGGSYWLLHGYRGRKCCSHLLDGLPRFLGTCSCNSAAALQDSKGCLAFLVFKGFFPLYCIPMAYLKLNLTLLVTFCSNFKERNICSHVLNVLPLMWKELWAVASGRIRDGLHWPEGAAGWSMRSLLLLLWLLW